MTRRERLEAKLQRRRDWATSRTEKAQALFAQNAPYHGDIAFNTQPGHIPERARAAARTDRGYTHANMAQHHEEKAAGLATQLDTSIFTDDTDAAEQLTQRIAENEARRIRMKQINALYRKQDIAGLEALGISYEALHARLSAAGAYWGSAPHLPYELTNLGASIRRDRERLKEVGQLQAKQQKVDESADGVLVEPFGQYVRVTFAEKPSREVLDALRSVGFRWGQGSWVGEASKLPAGIGS